MATIKTESLTQDATKESSDQEVQWPLSYRIHLPEDVSGQCFSGPTQQRWWNHNLYRGPKDQPVEILYAKTKAESEAIARQFLNEPIVGFDMEWPWDSEKRKRLQDKVGLIQIASEDKIGLFHIGLHVGRTCDDIIAPSLRNIIESPKIIKTGVAVLNADFSRLVKFFGLKPKAAFELSHLHRLVTFGPHRPEFITTKLVKLATQVEDHLGLPLSKGNVRTSNWSRDLSQQQITYAAGDAYAGFMLFHCMNAKRVAMNPSPPIPILADKYLSGTMSSVKSRLRPIHLEPAKEGGVVTTPMEFFGVKEEPKAENEEDATVEGQPTAEQPKQKARKSKPAKEKSTDEPLDALSKELYDRLSTRRLKLASSENVPAYVIANNSVLEGLARKRPVDDKGLLEIRGIGPVKQKKYGAHWLEVITQFTAERDLGPLEQTGESREPTTPKPRARRTKIVTADKGSESPPSSPAFGSPLVPTPQLHTGLSFQLEGTNLELKGSIDGSEDENAEVIGEEEFIVADRDHFDEEEDDEDSQEYFVTPAESSSQLKRRQSVSQYRYRGGSPSLKRRSPSPCAGGSPALPLPQPPLSPRSKLFQNKVVAFSRQVARTIGLDPLDPLLSEDTLRHIVMKPPKTLDELHRISGITKLVEACAAAEKDLLKNIIKFAPVRY